MHGNSETIEITGNWLTVSFEDYVASTIRRTPNPWECSLIALFGQLGNSDLSSVLKQLKSAEVIELDDQGQIRFEMSSPAPEPIMTSVFPLTAVYFDVDGWPVFVIVHAEDGVLSSIERYRATGDRINMLWPRLDQVRLFRQQDEISI